LLLTTCHLILLKVFNLTNDSPSSISLESFSLRGCKSKSSVGSTFLYVCLVGKAEQGMVDWPDRTKWRKIALTGQAGRRAPLKDTRAQQLYQHQFLSSFRLDSPVVVAKGATVGVMLEGFSVEIDRCSSVSISDRGVNISRAQSDMDSEELCTYLPFGTINYSIADGEQQCRTYSRGPDLRWHHTSSFAACGSGGKGELFNATSVIVDKHGTIFVSDTGNSRIQVYRSDLSFLTSLGSKGTLPGQFDRPIGLAISETDNLLAVADCYNQRVQVFDLAALISTDTPFAQLEGAKDSGKSA